MLNFLTSQSSFFSIFILFAAGAVISLIFNKNDKLANIAGNSFAILGSVSGIMFSSAVLISGKHLSLSTPTSFPFFSLSFNADYLASFFILIISLLALLSSIYAFGYVKHFYKKYNLGVLGFFYNAFIAGMIMVVTSSNAIFFLIAWEIMSLASYFLVVYEKNQEANIKAGTLYFIMTHAGTAFIIFLFLILYGKSGSFEFEAMRNSASLLSPALKNTVFIAALIGFGTKAGIIPLHIWLPAAHPAAPSHVSALMSGVMIKTGIYMMIRIFFDIMPNTLAWWGMTILIIGSISSLLGVLYALAEHDIKKLLAYHSIENIGIILLGLGSSLVFLSFEMKTLAILGLIASLYHTMNHAIFKALLFLGAGAVISETHTRNIEEYGGLIKYMPVTAFLFLVGSMAISALPPLNGFISEWFTFQSLFVGIVNTGMGSKIAFIIAAGALAFTGGLAAACFVKVFGAVFLARPRSEKIENAKESSPALLTGMSTLALLTVLLGFSAGPVVNILKTIGNDLAAFNLISLPDLTLRQNIIVNENFASISMPMIFAGIIIFLSAVSAVIWFITRKRKVDYGRTWDCGTDLSPRMEITATGFSRSIITVFKNVLRPTTQRGIEYHDANLRYFPKISTVHLGLNDIYHSYFYNPLSQAITAVSEKVRKIQSGNINAYILYILITLVVLLFAVTRK